MVEVALLLEQNMARVATRLLSCLRDGHSPLLNAEREKHIAAAFANNVSIDLTASIVRGSYTYGTHIIC